MSVLTILSLSHISLCLISRELYNTINPLFLEVYVTKYVAAVDQGTTSTRFIVFDPHGNVVAVDQKEHRQIFPAPGWVEHDPLEIWECTKTVIHGALTRFGIQREEIVASRDHQPTRDNPGLEQTHW